MVSASTVIIISVVVLVVIIVIAVVAVYISSRHNSSTGGATGCSSTCTSVPHGCNAANSLVVGYTGANCSAACVGSTATVTVTGCAAPVCGSPYCTPGAALYTTVSGNNNLVQQCSSGSTGSGFIPNTCTNNSSNGVYLNGLSPTASQVANNQIFPIFITTIGGSVYQTTTPVPPSGVDPRTLMGNTTDPTVVDNPYLLYWNSTNKYMMFKRYSEILALNDINGAIWIYESALQQVYPFEFLGSSTTVGNITSTILNPTFNGAGLIDPNYDYVGQYAPCSYNTFNANYLASANTTTYDGNLGWFQFAQPGELFPGTLVTGYMRGTNSSITDVNNIVNNLIVSADSYNPAVNFGGGTCSITDYSRWYSISALNVYL